MVCLFNNASVLTVNICYIYYDTSQWVWIFADTPCGKVISIYTDCYTSLAVLFVICVLDSITLIKLRMTNNVRLLQTLFTSSIYDSTFKVINCHNAGSIMSTAAQKKRLQTEKRFFIQVNNFCPKCKFQIQELTINFTDPLSEWIVLVWAFKFLLHHHIIHRPMACVLHEHVCVGGVPCFWWVSQCS